MALGFWCDEAVTRWVKTEVVVVAVVVAVAVAGVIPLVAAVRLRCALCGEKLASKVLDRAPQDPG